MARIKRGTAEVYAVTRLFRDYPDKRQVVAKGMTLEEAQAHCSDPETSSSTCTNPEGIARTKHWGPWFDSYDHQR